jgi:hypothetical protein
MVRYAIANAPYYSDIEAFYSDVEAFYFSKVVGWR